MKRLINVTTTIRRRADTPDKSELPPAANKPLPYGVEHLNLRVTPFWQESLGGSNETPPLSLFVVRAVELVAHPHDERRRS